MNGLIGVAIGIAIIAIFLLIWFTDILEVVGRVLGYIFIAGVLAILVAGVIGGIAIVVSFVVRLRPSTQV